MPFSTHTSGALWAIRYQSQCFARDGQVNKLCFVPKAIFGRLFKKEMSPAADFSFLFVYLSQRRVCPDPPREFRIPTLFPCSCDVRDWHSPGSCVSSIMFWDDRSGETPLDGFMSRLTSLGCHSMSSLSIESNLSTPRPTFPNSVIYSYMISSQPIRLVYTTRLFLDISLRHISPFWIYLQTILQWLLERCVIIEPLVFRLEMF